MAFDSLVANVASPFAGQVLFYAQLFGPLEGGWTPYANADGTRFYQDGRGRPTAVLTAAGEVVATGWACQREPLPDPPAC